MGVRSGAQAGRWLAMLDLLSRTKAGMTVGELAREFNCAPRTVYRDLQALQSRLGAALVSEPDDAGAGPRWRMMDGARWHANLEVTPSELVALLAATKVAAPLSGTPLGAGLVSLAAKLKGRTSGQAALFAEEDSAMFAVKPSRRDYARFAGSIETLREAIREHRTVEMTYFSLSQRAETIRRVDPWRLWWTEGGLYLVGFCHVHGGEPRTFAVERIRRARALEERFTPRTDVSWADYVRGAFGVFRGPEARVVVHFSARVAPFVRERVWHESQELIELPAGEVGLAMTVSGIDEVARWVLGFGGDARAIEPDTLVRRVRAEAEAIQKRHATGRAVAPEAKAARRARR